MGSKHKSKIILLLGMPLNSHDLTPQASASTGDATQPPCVSKGLEMGDGILPKIFASGLGSEMPEHASVFVCITHFFLTCHAWSLGKTTTNLLFSPSCLVY